MKKTTLWIFILACLVSVISAQEKIGNQQINIQTVDYCDLRKNPELYNGKMIRVHGVYEYRFEVEAFYNKSCFEDSYFSRHETWIERLSKNLSCSDKKTAEVIETLFEYYMHREGIEATLIGTFYGSEKHGGFGHLGGYKFQIKVSCIEQAKLLPIEKYGCKRVDETKPFHYLSYVKTEIGKAPNYEINSQKQKTENLVWLALNNNSTCSITIPTVINKSENQDLKNRSEVPVVYQLSSRCVTKGSKLITEREQTFATLSSASSIYFAVPLKYLTKEPYDIRVAFNFLSHNADSFYQPFYFSQLDLPKSLRKDIDCRKF